MYIATFSEELPTSFVNHSNDVDSRFICNIGICVYVCGVCMWCVYVMCVCGVWCVYVVCGVCMCSVCVCSVCVCVCVVCVCVCVCSCHTPGSELVRNRRPDDLTSHSNAPSVP
jgi:hypothetical protein